MKKFPLTFALLVSYFCVPLVWGQTDAGDKKVILTNEASINSEKLEYSPAFYQDGIVFVSNNISKKKYKIIDKRIGKTIMSIFRAKRNESGLLSAPEPLSDQLLTPVHEGPMTFDRTGETMYFTRNNYAKGKKKRRAKDGEVKMQIFSATKDGESWGEPKRLSLNDDNSNNMHPAISVDGDMLYFVSDREGGFGGMDIYVSIKQGDDWGEPINLGPAINTEAQEAFPFLHADGTLYFSSNGHSGYGGLDIFYAKRKRNSWTKPANLEKPFNSEKDDIGFIIDRDKKNGYISSNRDGGLGEDDIYSFYIATNLDELTGEEQEKPTRQMDILVIDYSSGDPVPEAQVNYMNLNDLTIARAITGLNGDSQISQNNELMLRLSMNENSEAGITDFSGKYPLKLTASNYILSVEKDGYQPRMVVLTADSELNELLVSVKKLSDVPSESIAGTNTNPNNTNSGNSTSGHTNPNRDTPYDTSPDGSSYDDNTNSNRTNNPNTDPTADNTNSATTSNNESNSGSNNGLSEEDQAALNGAISSTISEGTVFELPNIYYNFNDATIRPDAEIDLDALATFLEQYPDIEIELASHTDSRGGTRYNRRLSQKRADNAVRYLSKKGIDANRISAVGYGEQKIRNHCLDGIPCNEFEHQYNRRTEVTITRMKGDINVQFVNDPTESTPDYVSEPAPDYNNTSPSENYGSSDGTYRVIAGVYSSYDNAIKKLQRIHDLGYNEAEVVIDPDSQMHNVLVRRFDSKREAKAFSRKLKKSSSIRSFVKS